MPGMARLTPSASCSDRSPAGLPRADSRCPGSGLTILRRMRRVGAVLVVTALLVAACSGDDGGDAEAASVDDAFAAAMAEQSTEGVTTTGTSPDGGLTVSTVSTRADAVTDGNVLLRVDGEAVAAGPVEVSVDGEAIEVVFDPATRDGPADLRLGLLDGMVEGQHLVEVTAGGETAALAVINHPITGPVFSGPHLEPWVCHTEESGLGPPTDEDCSAPTVTSYSYVTRDGE